MHNPGSAKNGLFVPLYKSVIFGRKLIAFSINLTWNYLHDKLTEQVSPKHQKSQILYSNSLFLNIVAK